MSIVLGIFLTYCSYSQQCDCQYPIIFVHGWNGNYTSWEGIYNSSKFKNAYGDFDKDKQVYNAVLNPYGDASTHIWGVGQQPDYPDYFDDNVIVHEQFTNTSTLDPERCYYIINFDAFWNINNVNPQVITEDIVYPFGTSPSNQAAVFKQGYALGKMIDHILDITQKDKVILVGHSMGGLASREYLQRTNGIEHTWWVDPLNPEGHKVAKLLTAVTPHRGSNTGNEAPTWLPGPAQYLLGFDLQSEAVRDLRYSYLNEYSGVYLFGEGEGDIPTNNPNELYYNRDVNCNGVQTESIEGINISGLAMIPALSNSWSGTHDNPTMPLPTDIKYTYYVSNIENSNLPWVSDNSDGIVLAERQFLYKDSLDQSPRPFINKEYFASDIILVDNSYHLSVLDNSIFTTSATNDFENIMRGLDEADFAFHAYKVKLDELYKAFSQKRASTVADNSNAAINGGSNNDPNIDSDWYSFQINEENNLNIDITKKSSQLFVVDVFDQINLDSYTNNLTPLISITSDANTSDMNLNLNQLVSGDYYLRISSVVEVAGANEYSFIISSSESQETTTGPCIGIVYADYFYNCGGEDLFLTTGAQWGFNGRDCNNEDPNNSGNGGGFSGGGGSGGSGGPGGPGGGGVTTAGSGSSVPVINENDECQECVRTIQELNQILISRLNSNGN